VIKVIGLDLKPARSGIAVNFDRETGEPRVTTGATEPAEKDLHDRVSHTELAVMWRCLAHQPDIAFVEGTFSRGTASDYGQIAVHFGVTRVLRRLGVPWVNVQATTAKLWAAGSGSASKDDVARGLIQSYGRVVHLDPRDDDAADALALLTLGAAACGQHVPGPVPERNRKAASTVRELLPPGFGPTVQDRGRD
jgi:Holliday junction resolvasome RuvABC endonuclease subunit